MKKKKKMKLNLSLRNKLIASFVLILLVPSLCISLFSYQSAKDKTEKTLMASAQKNVSIVEDTISEFISAQMESVEYLSNTIQPENIEQDKDAQTRNILDTIQSAKEDVAEQHYVGTVTGEFMNAPTSFQNPPGYDPRERPWYKQAMENKDQIIITDPYISNSSGEVVVTIAKTTPNNQGVVAMNLELESLAKIISSVTVGNEGYLFLLDGTSHVISHPTLDAGAEAEGDFYQNLYTSDSGQFDYVMDGDKKKMAFATNELTGWKISGTMLYSEVDQEVRPIFNTTITVITISIVISGFIVFFIIRSIIMPINRLVKASDQISQGDLSVEISMEGNSELGQLAQSFNRMRKHLNQLIKDIRDKANNLSNSSDELNASTEQNTTATEQISTSIQDIVVGMDNQSSGISTSEKTAEEMVVSIQDIATSSNEVSTTSNRTMDAVKEGNKAIETTLTQMESIKKNTLQLSNRIEGLGNLSQQISNIIDVITNISEQTNLLALNAAIEAARAGEHGKGFAVVADEVRNLAEESSHSAEQIKEMIGKIQNETTQTVESMNTTNKQVEKGMEVANNAGESFTDITGYVDTITAQIKNVVSKVEAISDGAEEFTQAFKKISDIAENTTAETQNVSAATEQQLASMEEISNFATSLTEIARELEQTVEQFKLS
ncbi:methyl-accepting chemotaxis protein [Gracilibacillus dipsosauri]|uniref:Methyl-accepting chemotaxis protein n=1 Tax=Gracilibacillus dipsosauri TaxID=178340 RepID=A0A317KV75_9BACI|nr:methyl-accepting chemotaxis protein [Gracilibacillus dipsosauri]PWU67203.1 methyl-accepting chemotaxis protein [Gracilibacillus dipsosauri]